MSESERKAALVKQIREMPHCYARRVEDRYAVGVLDLIFKFPGWPTIYAEGKWIKTGNTFSPTLRQWQEGKKLLAANCLPLLIAWKKPQGKLMQMYICTWREQAVLDDCFIGPGTDTTSAQTLLAFLDQFIEKQGIESHSWYLERTRSVPA